MTSIYDDYFHPWKPLGLTLYAVWAKDAEYHDRSRDVVAATPEDAIQMWRDSYVGWCMRDLEGPKVFIMGLPHIAGTVEVDISEGSVDFERRAGVWRLKAPCRYGRIDWVRA